jgi:hypothetical protein
LLRLSTGGGRQDGRKSSPSHPPSGRLPGFFAASTPFRL